MTGSAVEKGRLPVGPRAYRSGVDLLVLGPVEVRNHGGPVPIGGPKQRAILALLTADAGHPVSLERLVDDVYGEEAAEGARRSVRTFISMIRRELGDVVQKQGAGYALVVDLDAIDAFRFEEEVRAAIPMVQDEPEKAATSLREALAMWRGHPYADVDSRSLLQPEITRLIDLRLAALEARIEADLALGRHRELTGELEALVVEHPLRERMRAQLMLALYRSGRQTEALRAFERARLYLADEIGITPSAELSLLEQQILEQDLALDLPAAASVTQRAVLVVDVAGHDVLTQVGPENRGSLTGSLALVDAAVSRHRADASTQRGSAIYSSFLTVEEAVATVGEVMAAATDGTSPRASIDFGDIELHDSGDIAGPPVRRSAGMVAVAHSGQVLLSAEANHALMAGGQGGLVVRSLGTYRIHGVESPQQIFQLVMAGQAGEFPELLLDANPPPLPFDRKAVPGYELRQPIVSDLAGTTYRAYQPSAGREVELTVIDAAWAAEPDFVSRFEVETQLVSRLHHPHVVPLLDYWRDPSGAYLVSLSVGGGTVAERLATGEIEVEEVRRLVTQIGEALLYAHEMGIGHGAISPRAIVVDESGNGYLTATGFVLRLVGAPLSSSVYMAPESADGAPASLADIYGLGRLAEELLGSTTSGDTPGVGKLRTVIEKATAQREADRFPSMGDFLAAWNEESGRGERGPGPSTLRNPYKGLSAFREPDAGDFFGRSESVTDLLGMLGAHDMVAVVGPSGSGKSSLMHAGLIPAVRAGAMGGSSHWVVADMFPGSYPLEELESALSRVAVEDPGALIDELGSDDRGLARVIKRVLPVGTSLLLVIDQFEELFTLTRDELSRSRLLQALLNLAMDERSDTKVVLTLRADFVDRPLQYHEFGELLKAGTFLLTVPGSDELIEAIKRPSESVGATWEPGLPEQILDDVAQSPGLLPLLQYSLTELFEGRRSDQLTVDVYRENGGVIGALAGRAEEVFTHLDQSEQELARQLFLRLVTVQSSGEGTRRRTRLVDLNALGDPGEVGAVLGAFGEARLLVFDRDPLSRSPTVEVAHEALLTRWPRLNGWIDDAGEDLLLHGRFRDAAEEWEDRERDPGYLATGGRLAQFETWAVTTELTLAPSEAEYLAASREESDQSRTRRRRRRNLITAGFGAAALVAGVFAVNADRNAEIAESRELAASAISVLDEDPELSVLLALEAAGRADPSFESVSALHASLAAHHKVFTYQWPTDREAVTLWTRLSPDGTLLAAGAGTNDIEIVEIASGDRLWGREFPEGTTVRMGWAPDGSSLLVTVGRESPDGSAPSPALQDALGVHRLDYQTGAQIDHLPMAGACRMLVSPELLSVIGPNGGTHLLTEVSPDPGCIAEIAEGEALDMPPMALLDLDTAEVEMLSAMDGGAHATPDGSRLLVQVESEGTPMSPAEVSARVLDVATGREVAVLPGFPAGISGDGRTVLTTTHQLMTWDVSSGQPDSPLMSLDRYTMIGARAIRAWLSPDGSTVVRALGSSLDLIDARSGQIEKVLRTGLGSNDRLSFSADGSVLSIGEVFGATGVVFDMDAPTEMESVQLCDRFSFQTGAVEVRGDTTSVFAGCDETVSLGLQFLIDPISLKVEVPTNEQGGARSALSPDGSLLAAQLGRGTIRAGDPGTLFSQVALHDTTTGEVVQVMDGLCEWEERAGHGPDCVRFPDRPFPAWTLGLAFSSDGSLLAAGSQDTDAILLWDTSTGELVATPTVPHNTEGVKQALDIEFSPEGDRMAASFVWTPKELWMISTQDWTPITQYRPPDGSETFEAPSDNLVFTPDGEILIGTDFSGLGEGRIVFMDGTTLEHLDEITDAHKGGVAGLALNQDGTLLASAGIDGVVRVWDVASRSLVHEVPVAPVGDGVGGVAFVGSSPHVVATAMEAGELRKFTTDTEELLSIARERITRGFTDTECTTYRIDPCQTLEEIRNG